MYIAAGKHPKYIAAQAGHASAGFTMDRYGHLFETIAITPVEWVDDLLWPNGCPDIETDFATTLPPELAPIGGSGQSQAGECTSDGSSEALADRPLQQ